MSLHRSNITDRPGQAGSGGRDVSYWLREVRAEGIVLVRTRVAGRWGFEVEARDAAFFHFVTEGHAYVRRSGAKTIELLPGDLVLLPRGTAHEVSHSIRGRTVPLRHFLASQNGVFSPVPTATTIICGEFGMDRHMVLPAIQSLPLAVHLRASNAPGRTAVGDTLRLLRSEVETADFGNQIVVRHLLSTLFVYVLREWADAASPLSGNWFSALRSPHIARALACIHEAPANDWTLDTLAEAAGLSRSAFAGQFRTSVGEPPHSYLIRWRMGIAAGGNRSPRRLQVGICFQPRLRSRTRAFTGAVSESSQLRQLTPRVREPCAAARPMQLTASTAGYKAGYRDLEC